MCALKSAVTIEQCSAVHLVWVCQPSPRDLGVSNIIAAPFRRGVHPLKRNNWGEYDNMTPRSAIVDPAGLALCIYLTKPGTKTEEGSQEIHLMRLSSPPEDIAKVFYDRPVFLPKFRQFTHLVFDRVQSTSVIVRVLTTNCSTLEPRYDT